MDYIIFLYNGDCVVDEENTNEKKLKPFIKSEIEITTVLNPLNEPLAGKKKTIL